MALIGYVLSGLIALGIVFIGVRFLWASVAAARDFGVPQPSVPAPARDPWLAVKGVRDIASGLFVLLLMSSGSTRLLGEFLLVASLIPMGDATIVLRSGGSRMAAFGIHGSTALVLIAAGACLIGATQAPG